MKILPVSSDKEMEENRHLQLAEVCSNAGSEASSECHEVSLTHGLSPVYLVCGHVQKTKLPDIITCMCVSAYMDY